ncbi:MAG: type II toxin-antitoxin system VapC family toxin [Actinobacteria bacterium]|nr:type II toxin-antitoxin system VapC family toxin [Actinomycetota bacterium]
MIVLDASVAVGAALGRRVVLGELSRHDLLVAPHLVDAEVLHTLRGHLLSGKLSEPAAAQAVANWSSISVQRRTTDELSGRVWELRHNVTAYDATYVALAESYRCTLLTADRRLAAASGPRCAVTVLRE